jgi:glycosyltransferase involved in cell wall biosynthesis
VPRILAVNAVAAPGGAEINVLRLLRGLADRGWRATVASPAFGPLAIAARADGHSWTPLPTGGLAARAGARAVLSWPRARRLARGHDLVYLNGGVPARLLPALPRGVPVVLHVHDMVRRVPRFWRRADLVLAPSRAAAARLAPLEAHAVYGPVDPDPPPADPPWPDAGDGRPVVAFVGRLEARKAPLDLVRAAPLITRARPDVRVVVAGDDAYAPDSAYLREVKASPEVEHTGWVANAPGVLRHVDVLVLPSREEPFGTVLSEAMAVGTPVVATAVDGLPEVVEDGVTGVLVQPGDPSAIADGVLHVLEHRAVMGDAARRAAARFHTDAYVHRMAALLEPLLG